MNETQKPTPIIDGDSRHFWEKCKEGKFLIRHCEDCNQDYFYPRSICPHCMSDQVTWKEASGKGKVYSFTVARRAAGVGFSEDVPYAIGIIELEEGVRVMSNIVNVPVDDIYCDMPVQVTFEKRSDFDVFLFEPAK